MHSVHVKVNSDCSIELTGLDDILNASGPCPPSGGGGTTPFSPATLAPATVATAVATGGQPAPCNQCTDAHGNCIPCPPSGGGSKY
jgi:hypothetical protein